MAGIIDFASVAGLAMWAWDEQIGAPSVDLDYTSCVQFRGLCYTK